MKPIISFSGNNSFLSNFYVESSGKSVEHYFQSAKTIDIVQKRRILAAISPAEAKRLGREIKLRDDWETLKIPTMARAVAQKFIENDELAMRLHKTGHALLVEGNTWHDNEWGDCRCRRTSCKYPGNNILGIILMTVRATL